MFILIICPYFALFLHLKTDKAISYRFWYIIRYGFKLRYSKGLGLKCVRTLLYWIFCNGVFHVFSMSDTRILVRSSVWYSRAGYFVLTQGVGKPWLWTTVQQLYSAGHAGWDKKYTWPQYIVNRGVNANRVLCDFKFNSHFIFIPQTVCQKKKKTSKIIMLFFTKCKVRQLL